MTKPLTARRIARLLATCKTPRLAGRACERVYNVACKSMSYTETKALLSLSSALNEHRHMLLAELGFGTSEASEHAERRTSWVMAAVRNGEGAP